MATRKGAKMARGVLACIIETVIESRKRQAEREIRRHADLNPWLLAEAGRRR